MPVSETRRDLEVYKHTSFKYQILLSHLKPGHSNIVRYFPFMHKRSAKKSMILPLLFSTSRIKR